MNSQKNTKKLKNPSDLYKPKISNHVCHKDPPSATICIVTLYSQNKMKKGNIMYRYPIGRH